MPVFYKARPFPMSQMHGYVRELKEVAKSLSTLNTPKPTAGLLASALPEPVLSTTSINDSCRVASLISIP